MSDKIAAETGKARGWLKTAVGSAAGLLSGALVMYLSPLLDKAVKPARPVANFAVDHEGTTVTFHNHSSGGSEGWWDFGDGSPLEPVSSKQETIAHTYASPGTYLAKLTLRNFVNEESERTVNLELGAGQAEAPTIEALEAIPISPGAYAPATFRVVSRSKNAKMCIWDLGDDSPLQISTDKPNEQDRLVTFKEPGSYMVKLAAVNGEVAREKSTVVSVDVAPAGLITAIVTVADQGLRVETVETSVPVSVAFPPGPEKNTYAFDRPLSARPGYEITAARWEPINDRAGRGLNLQVAADRRTARLTGELVKDGALKKGSTPPALLVRAVLKQERRVPHSRPAVPVTGLLAVPGSALLVLPPLPANWADAQRTFHLELREGDRVVWHESQLPRGAVVTVQNRRCTLTATPIGSQVRVELVEIKPGLKPTAN
jgi:PKD repeat protein